MVRFRLRRGVERFFSVLDSEGVVFFQTLVYAHLAAGGFYCLIVAREAPTSILAALGHTVSTAWLWLCMGSLTCLAGKLLSAKPNRRAYWVHTTGLHLQIAGDIFALGAFTGYVLATWQESPWGKALIAMWVFAALALCAFFLCWRDLRRIEQAERAVRR